MLKRTLFAGLALTMASLGAPGTANAHRYGMAYPGARPAHAVRGVGSIHAARRGAAATGGARARSPWRAPAAAAAGELVGRASFYAGGRTASGGSVGAATCAHRSLPFGTRVLVTNLANSRQMVLTVNDRGPFAPGRIVDVSRTAAAALGMLQSGVAAVRVQVIGGPG